MEVGSYTYISEVYSPQIPKITLFSTLDALVYPINSMGPSSSLISQPHPCPATSGLRGHVRTYGTKYKNTLHRHRRCPHHHHPRRHPCSRCCSRLCPLAASAVLNLVAAAGADGAAPRLGFSGMIRYAKHAHLEV